MKFTESIRTLVFLRRSARALERIADAQQELAEIARARFNRENVKRLPRATEFGSFDVAEANSRWQKEEEAREFGQIPEDAT